MQGILNNKWPCCGKPTRWSDAQEMRAGETFVRICPKDGRTWQVTVDTGKVVIGSLVFRWNEVGGRAEKLAAADVVWEKSAHVEAPTEMTTYHITGVNPEPWVAPQQGHGRVFKSAGLSAYQEAIKEEIVQQNGHVQMHEGDLVVQFYFWRNTDNGEVDADTKSGTRKRRRNEADATNMQKACEDALQKILFGNDKSNRLVSSLIVDVGPDVQPHIAIEIEPFDIANWQVPEIPSYAPVGSSGLHTGDAEEASPF